MLLWQLSGQRREPSVHHMVQMQHSLCRKRYVHPGAKSFRVLTMSSAFETCGGPGALELMFNPHPTTVTTSSAVAGPSSPAHPAVWTAAGCAQDGAARALTGYSITSNAMTAALCQTACAAQGYSIAGTEYSSECYCESLIAPSISLWLTYHHLGGNSFSNGLGATIASSSCSMTCSGNSGAICGGPYALTVFKLQ